MQYWYTAQLRNYRLQFIRAFSNFYVSKGTDTNGNEIIEQVPCRYGDPSRIASTIVAGNSENKIPTVPFITCIVSSVAMAATRRQDPSFVSKIQVNEREYDEETSSYLQNQGNKYTVERYMPVPYDLTMQVDIWTNNTSIKEQLLEQILTIYNPSIDIQTSNNALDWTVLTVIEMLDQITWSSRTIPIGTENPIDVMTLTFKLPIWINPPAKVKKQQIIEQIVTNIINGNKDSSEQWDWTEYEFLSRVVTTPGNYNIVLDWIGDNSYNISLTTQSGDVTDDLTLPTITMSKENPVFTPGTSFRYNGIPISIANSDIASVVAAGHAALIGSDSNIQLYNKKQIKFINNTGSNNMFDNIVGQPIQDMGLLPTIYPGGTLSWDRLLEAYGNLKSYDTYGVNASQLRIRLDIDDPNKDIIGWLSPDSINQNILIWKLDLDSLPGVTLPPVNAIVNPSRNGPGSGLPFAQVGQRYLLLDVPPNSSESWGQITNVNANDIIEFNGTEWQVAFNSEQNQFIKNYVVNLFNGKLVEWSDNSWGEYIGKNYGPGDWRLAL